MFGSEMLFCWARAKIMISDLFVIDINFPICFSLESMNTYWFSIEIIILIKTTILTAHSCLDSFYHKISLFDIDVLFEI